MSFKVSLNTHSAIFSDLYRCLNRRLGHSLLALKDFQGLCSGKVVLILTNNTTVVVYKNKDSGMRLGSLCALLWRILTWCSRIQVTLKALDIPGRLNVVANKLYRLGQIIQTKRSLLPEVFQFICNRWH